MSQKSKKTLKISGMSCGHCTMAVEKALKEVSGVEEVNVDLDKALATITGTDFDEEALKTSVENAGYQVES